MRSVAGTELSRTQYLQHIASDYKLMVTALAGPVVAVPTCPGWDTNELAHHMGMVYLHQAFVIEHGERPEAKEHRKHLTGSETDMELLAAGHLAITGALDPGRAERKTWSWHHNDFSVDFWFRRMAHETLIHRVDAQLATGVIPEISELLALDGVDEVLDFLPLLGSWDGAPNVAFGIVSISAHTSTGQKHWTLEFTTESATVTAANQVDPNARLIISGDAIAMDLYLWGRIDSADPRITLAGDDEAGFKQLMQVAVN
jgi:hypothetical protein